MVLVAFIQCGVFVHDLMFLAQSEIKFSFEISTSINGLLFEIEIITQCSC